MGNVLSMLVCVCVSVSECVPSSGQAHQIFCCIRFSALEQSRDLISSVVVVVIVVVVFVIVAGWLSISLARRGGQKIAGDAT